MKFPHLAKICLELSHYYWLNQADYYGTFRAELDVLGLSDLQYSTDHYCGLIDPDCWMICGVFVHFVAVAFAVVDELVGVEVEGVEEPGRSW